MNVSSNENIHVAPQPAHQDNPNSSSIEETKTRVSDSLNHEISAGEIDVIPPVYRGITRKKIKLVIYVEM
ncbi:6190_t:CDS:2 [Ambispora leptoticha]|uniref:6190_t:CDS:1 n=1 Tax=Ambispora leptoticha TaxID=144679 RepID=A0A9N8VR13_9GLOM|nr:6190_t:CDS:2 [Ambispora leptoticha]